MTHQQDVADQIAQLRREKSARERRDVTQEEIARAIGITTVTYSRYESGKRKVPEEVVEALAAYYGVTAPYIRYRIPPSQMSGQLTDAEIAAAHAASDAARRAREGVADQPAPVRRRGAR